MADQPKIGPSSIARIAGNILSGVAANPLRRGRLTSDDADNALKIARYIAKKAQERGEDNG